MKRNTSRLKRGAISVDLNKQKTLKTNSSQQILAPENSDFEIDRSLYYLGRALYRHSLLQKERSNIVVKK
ncbi:MAG: hypothetical protein H6772_02360 [Pseudomonadales bacterium]|nr:hypothetical protein [Pseudomonadales bacterium]